MGAVQNLAEDNSMATAMSERVSLERRSTYVGTECLGAAGSSVCLLQHPSAALYIDFAEVAPVGTVPAPAPALFDLAQVEPVALAHTGPL